MILDLIKLSVKEQSFLKQKNKINKIPYLPPASFLYALTQFSTCTCKLVIYMCSVRGFRTHGVLWYIFQYDFVFNKEVPPARAPSPLPTMSSIGSELFGSLQS